MPSLVDDSVQSTIVSTLSMEAGGAGATRVRRWDQLAADAASMWAVHLTTPTQSGALALQTASERGSGRTRAETNRPESTSAAAPVGT